MRQDRVQRDLEKRRKTETAQIVSGFSRGVAFDVGLALGTESNGATGSGSGQGLVLPIMGSRHIKGVLTSD